MKLNAENRCTALDYFSPDGKDKAHIFMCYLSYLLMKTLEHMLKKGGLTMNAENGLKQLSIFSFLIFDHQFVQKIRGIYLSRQAGYGRERDPLQQVLLPGPPSILSRKNNNRTQMIADYQDLKYKKSGRKLYFTTGTNFITH
jgi:hypothetical protein